MTKMPGANSRFHVLSSTGSTFSGTASAGRDTFQGDVCEYNNVGQVANHHTTHNNYFGAEQARSPAPEKEEPFKQPKCDRTHRNPKGSPAGGDCAAAKAPRYLYYRLTEIGINESQEAISDVLRGLDPEKGANKQFRISRGLDSKDRQTAVAIFKRQPSMLPRRGESRILSTDESRPLSSAGGGRPRVDADFHGLTTLSSPSYDFRALTSGRPCVIDSPRKASSVTQKPNGSGSPYPWAKYIECLNGYYGPGLSRDIRLE